MQKTNLFFKILMSISLLGLMLVIGISSYAVIPTVIASNSTYTVTGSENSLGSVTVQPNSTLIITGSNANAIINGNITVGSGAELQIYDGATVTFNGNVTINGGGILRIHSTAYNPPHTIQTIRMAAGTKIALKGNSSVVNGGAWAHITYARIVCATPGGYWKGLETSVTGSGTYTHSTQIDMSFSVVENAVCAYRNYDSDNANINATVGGLTNSIENIYRNNIRHLAIYNQKGVSVPPSALQTFNINDKVSMFFNCQFINEASFSPIPAPVDMVYLNNSSNISFYNCQFTNLGDPNVMNACINAVNAGFFLRGLFGTGVAPLRNTIAGFVHGVVVTNSLETDRVCVIMNTDFNCAKSINMSGCFNPYILNCSFTIPFYNFPPAQPPYDVVGAYLNNCTGYKIEGNNSFGHFATGPFAVLHNSGSANNEIYRNQAVYSVIGIQAVGINRNVSGSTGLKIMCNNIRSNATGISIVRDPSVLAGITQGVANQHYTFSGINITSAGNKFGQDPNYLDIYFDPALNTSSQFVYRYNSAAIAEQPLYNNTALNIATTPHSNTCPVRNEGATPQPFPFALFVSENRSIEAKINAITAAATDPSEEATLAILDPLYMQHSQNINAISTYYQHMAATDTTGHNDDYQDSLELVYQAVTVGYEYQIYLASAYADKGVYEKALATLAQIPGKYKLTDEENKYIRNLQELFTVRQWLYFNDGNWKEIPDNLKQMVYENEKNDPMFAGAMGRAILVQYEGATYTPFYVVPSKPIMQQAGKLIKLSSNSKIYPNPTTGHATVNWDGDDAVLVLHNTNGQKMYQINIKSGKNELDLSQLVSGTYIAQILVNGKQVYQQHLIKK